MLSSLWNDVRYSARTLSRNPGLAAAAIVTIGIGVGINTGIFSILNGLVFRDLPAPDAHEIVTVYQAIEGVPSRAGLDGVFTTSEYETYREQTRTLSALAGHSQPWEATLGGESPQQISGTIVTCSYFDVLGQRPALGRGLTEADCTPGADPVVVLGHEFWTSAFGADPAVLGRTVELNRQLFNVVGVVSEGTYAGFFYSSAFFAPTSTQPLLTPERNEFADDGAGWLVLLGRRAAGIGIDQVRAEFGVIAAQIDTLTPGRSTTLSIERSTPVSYPLCRTSVLGLGTVGMGAVGLGLMFACANVA
jgi:hypothetical protein